MRRKTHSGMETQRIELLAALERRGPGITSQIVELVPEGVFRGSPEVQKADAHTRLLELVDGGYVTAFKPRPGKRWNDGDLIGTQHTAWKWYLCDGHSKQIERMRLSQHPEIATLEGNTATRRRQDNAKESRSAVIAAIRGSSRLMRARDIVEIAAAQPRVTMSSANAALTDLVEDGKVCVQDGHLPPAQRLYYAPREEDRKERFAESAVTVLDTTAVMGEIATFLAADDTSDDEMDIAYEALKRLRQVRQLIQKKS